MRTIDIVTAPSIHVYAGSSSRHRRRRPRSRCADIQRYARACCFYRWKACFQRSAMKDPALTQRPPVPRWFGPRASTDDPAVAALLDQVAPAGTWENIGGEFNLNI